MQMYWMTAAAPLLTVFATPGPAQQSAAPFDAPLVTLFSLDRYGLLVDLDQDGFMDAVSWWWSGPSLTSVRLRGWRNDGTGKLVLAWSTVVSLGELGAGTFRILPCNLDSDGSTDFYLVFSALRGGRHPRSALAGADRSRARGRALGELDLHG